MVSVSPGSSLRARLQGKATIVSYIDTLLAAFPSNTLASGPHPSRNTQHHPSSLYPLSQREMEVLKALAQGASNKEIASMLTIAHGTVKRHVSNIISKLGVTNRTQVATRAYALGLLLDERESA